MSEQGTCDCDYSDLQSDTEGLCQSVFIYNEKNKLIGIDCPDPESPCKDDPNFPNLWKECSNGRENTRCLTKGVWHCNDDTGEVYCTAEVIEPESEVCDGIDNDCDEKVDEDFDVDDVCYDGLGVCMDKGIKVCSDDKNSTYCNAEENTSNKSAETCANIGIDNDCDGETDDVDGLDSCTDAPYDNKTANNCIDTGTYQCVDGAPKCSAKAPTKGETEVCDGIDNDCDGQTDEDCLYSCDDKNMDSALDTVTTWYQTGFGIQNSIDKTLDYSSTDYIATYFESGNKASAIVCVKNPNVDYAKYNHYNIGNIYKQYDEDLFNNKTNLHDGKSAIDTMISSIKGATTNIGERDENKQYSVIGGTYDADGHGNRSVDLSSGRENRKIQLQNAQKEYKISNKDTASCFICATGREYGCFAPETLIALADGSQKQAKDVAVGDKLFNPVTRSAVTVRRVIEGPEALGLIRIKFKDGELKVSQDHPMLTANGLKAAKDLKAGELIFNGDNEQVIIEEVKVLAVEEGQWVVNFLLEGADMSKSENRMLLSDGIISGDLQTQLELSGK